MVKRTLNIAMHLVVKEEKDGEHYLTILWRL